MVAQQFEQRTRELIDSLKAICAAYGLGNDGNEFKIITQVFLYKFLNDKFAFEAKKIRPALAQAESWEAAIAAMSAEDVEMLQMQMGADTARLKPEHFIAHLFGRQNAPEFAKLFDDTLRDIAITNNDIFAVKTDGGANSSPTPPSATPFAAPSSTSWAISALSASSTRSTTSTLRCLNT